MPKPSSLSLAKNQIFEFIESSDQRVYSEAELNGVLLRHSSQWALAKSTNGDAFVSFLLREGKLEKNELTCDEYGRRIVRYSWGKAHVLELAQSIKARGYLSHGTALLLHKLNTSHPKTIYLNIEQSPKTIRSTSLAQDALDLAFSRQQRQSKLVYRNGSTTITIISGKNTNRLGVETVKGPNSEPLSATNLERTLIDIVVRPTYSGGLAQVVSAYRSAGQRGVSVDRLISYLKKLDYFYPYHQAIGFLMQATSFPKESYEQLRSLGLKHDFYLVHGMRRMKFSKDWRLHYPTNFDSSL